MISKNELMLFTDVSPAVQHRNQTKTLYLTAAAFCLKQTQDLILTLKPAAESGNFIYIYVYVYIHMIVYLHHRK